LQDYLDDLPSDALLTAEEERTLALAIRDGDQAALARLIRCNLRLVVRIARDYQDRGLSLDDLVGEGNLGLIRAAKDFDPAFGTRFSTYAAYWIKQAIRHALTTTGATIRLPSHVVNLMARWRRTERALTRRLGREPVFDEIADALDLTASHREIAARALSARQVLYEAGGDGASSWSGEEALDPAESPEAELEAREERQAVLRRLDRLDDRERTVIALRFGLGGGEPLTLKEVGRRLGITREWVRKIELRAVRKLEDRHDADAVPAIRPRRRLAQTA
jgi:RNA polymerase primary sigma factor